MIVEICVADSRDLCGWQQISVWLVCYSTYNCAVQHHSNDPIIVPLRLWQVHLLEEYIFTMLALSCDLAFVLEHVMQASGLCVVYRLGIWIQVP